MTAPASGAAAGDRAPRDGSARADDLTEAGHGIGITGVRTVGVPVRDQERALRFYVDALGFEKRMDVPLGPGRRWVEVAPAGSPTSIALVGVSDAGTVGVDTQIRLATRDAGAVHAELLRRGVDVDGAILPVPVPMFALRDADGNRLVIVQEP